MTSKAIQELTTIAGAEARLMVYALRAALDPCRGKGVRQSPSIANILSATIDWDRICEAALWHGTLGLVFKALKREVGPGFGARLRILGRHFVLNAARTRAMMTALFELLDRLSAAGICAVPYKGPILAAMIYGDVSMRVSGDIDLIVRRRDVRQAERLLLSGGYRVGRSLHGPAKPTNPRRAYHQEYHRPGDWQPSSPPVELHWHLADDLDIPVDLDEWIDRTGRASVCGRVVKVFPPEETLLALCAHGAKDAWNRLILVADVAGVISSQPQMDWRRVADLAATADARRILAIGVLLADGLLAAELPDAARCLAEPDRKAAVLATRVARRLLTARTAVVRADERIPLAMAIRTNPRARRQYIANYIRILVAPEEDAPDSAARWPGLRCLLRPLGRAGGAVRHWATKRH